MSSSPPPDGSSIPCSTPVPHEPAPPWLEFRRFGLSQRESEVLWWISQGKRNREIALILGLSLRTIHCHVASILQKLGVETRTAAVARLYELLNPPTGE